MVSPASRMLSAISFGRLPPLGALDEGDHPVEERLAGLLGHLDDEHVGEEAGAAGDGRAVAAGLTDDGCRLAGDRRLVDRADAFDRRRRPPGSPRRRCTTTTSPRASSGAGTSSSVSSRPRRCAVVVVRVARSALACALPRPSAIASAKFAKSTVSHSQNVITPTNQRLPVWPRARSSRKIPDVMTLPTSTMNMTGFRIWFRGLSFGNESLTAAITRSREKMLSDRRATTVPSSGRVRG